MRVLIALWVLTWPTAALAVAAAAAWWVFFRVGPGWSLYLSIALIAGWVALGLAAHVDREPTA
jgi:hypothetical protein